MRSFATALLVAGALVSQATATIYVRHHLCIAGTPCNVRWNDDVNALALATIGLCSIDLCTNGQQKQTCLQTIAQADVSSNAYVTYLPDASVGPNGTFCFVKFSPGPQGPRQPPPSRTTRTSPSSLSTIRLWYCMYTGMTGTFNSTVQAQISDVASSAAAAVATATSGVSAAAKTTAAASATKESASASSTTNGAIGVTAPVSSQWGGGGSRGRESRTTYGRHWTLLEIMSRGGRSMK